MIKSNILHKNYTINKRNYQLKLPINVEYMIPSNDSVRLLSQFIEELNLSDLYKTYSRVRENQASPRKLLKIIVYAYMNRIFSSRDIESACHRDINFMFLLEGSTVPDHSTFARFISLHFSQCSTEIMSAVTNYLYEIKEISGKNIFIDGTKIEADANKYTFVWKRAVTRNMENLLKKLAALVAECEELYGIKICYNREIHLHTLKKLKKKLYSLKKSENIKFVHGCGKKKTALQHSIEQLECFVSKLKEYIKKIHLCGDRNSYSKTDHDATFMRMKEDVMRNGQLKPAYNLQHGIDSEYITWLNISSQRSDQKTLIPFLKDMEKHLNFKYLKIVADSGYESEENYSFIEDNKQISFIKPTNYKISKTRKYKSYIGRAENMDYNLDKDYYICKNSRKLYKESIQIKKSKTGYESIKTIYRCKNCDNCNLKSSCIKGNNSKIPFEKRVKMLELSKKFQVQRTADLKRILSDEGCLLRLNRSIQAEGSFADLKEDMGFRRFTFRSKENVLAQSIILAFAHNVNKLHNKIQNKKTGTHLFNLNEIA